MNSLKAGSGLCLISLQLSCNSRLIVQRNFFSVASRQSDSALTHCIKYLSIDSVALIYEMSPVQLSLSLPLSPIDHKIELDFVCHQQGTKRGPSQQQAPSCGRRWWSPGCCFVFFQRNAKMCHTVTLHEARWCTPALRSFCGVLLCST